MSDSERPCYDHETRTHYIELPRAVYDALDNPIGMLNVSLFAEMVTVDEWVWVECGDDARLFRVTGVAAVVEPAPESEAS